MNSLINKQNIYIRKLNGLGQKISVEDSLKIKQLKDIVMSLKSLQTSGLKQKDFHLIFKGKNITENSENTLKQLGIPSDGIVHLVFASDQQKKNDILYHSSPLFSYTKQNHPPIDISVIKPVDINLRVIFSGDEHQFIMSQNSTVLDLKKKIATKLNLVFQSLILSHLGTQMLNEKQLSAYGLHNNTLISVKFNLQKPQKKKLQSRMVSSVTFSDQNNQPNKNQHTQQFQHTKQKVSASSKSIGSDKDESQQGAHRLTSLMNTNSRPMMYKSDINSFGASQASKAAMMFKNALHQKIVETQSIVSGSFSEDTSFTGCDPNSLMITVKNEDETKEFVFQCSKSHEIVNIRERLLQIERVSDSQKIQISMEEDLFQSIDLNKSGCVTLSEIVKKMGKERAVFIYRII